MLTEQYGVASGVERIGHTPLETYICKVES